jgi:hypothetical protein
MINDEEDETKRHKRNELGDIHRRILKEGQRPSAKDGKDPTGDGG